MAAERSTAFVEADWIRARLGAPGTVGGIVPLGYPAYVRILHPVPDTAGRFVDWETVARGAGRRVHPLAQWFALVGAPDSGTGRSPRWDGDAPEVGSLVPSVLAPLAELLAGFTGTPGRCWFCLWDGWGWPVSVLDGPTAARVVREARRPRGRVLRVLHALRRPHFLAYGEEPPTADTGWFGAVRRRRPGPGLASRVADALGPPHPAPYPDPRPPAPRVRLPHREYLLFAGAVTAATDLTPLVDPRWPQPQSPNLWWPADRAWCVATEIDADSTLVAGDRGLAAALLADPRFDAWNVGPDGDLTWDGDRVNPGWRDGPGRMDA